MKFVKWFTSFTYRNLVLVLLGALTSLALALSGAVRLAEALTIIVVALAASPIVRSMIESIIDRDPGVDILAVTAITAALLMHEYVAATVLIIMLTGGDALEQFATARAKAELSSLLSRAPKLAHRRDQAGKITDVAIEHIKVGDEIVIRSGEVVPVDAKIIEGTSSLDESALTGESLPIDKAVGDDLLSGSLNAGGLLIATATSTAGDSQYQHIVALVAEASSSRSPLIRLANRYSLPFTLLSFGIAGVAWAMSGNPVRFLEVLVVATPCPLLIATPVAIISGMSRLARFGVIVKGGGALEQLSRAKTVAFDKTGTLTHGDIGVSEVITFGELSKEDVVLIAATLEEGSSHILATAIVEEANEEHLKLPSASAVHETVSQGVLGRIDRVAVAVGKLEFVEAQGMKLPADAVYDDTVTQVVVGRGKQIIGSIVFSDKPRREAPATLRWLKQLHVPHTLMLTGDREEVARSVAGHLGITDVRAELLPGDKLAAVRELGPEMRPVVMVGDGVNDAPVLAAADVGIALGAKGSTAATESADAVIMLDDLRRVPLSVSVAKRTMRIASQSIGVGIGLSVILMILAARGGIQPAFGALLQEGVDVVVILNALRAHFGPEHLPHSV